MITTLLSFTLVIGILIFVHEFGHFIVAKKTGVEVEKFSLGFGPKLVGFKKGETQYMISAVPLGGYVKLKGENPDEPLTNDPKEFASRSVGVRGAIVSAGPIMNILLAFIFMPLVYFIGIQIPAFLEEKPEVYWVAENSPAQSAGFQVGDLIRAVDGKEVSNWEMFSLHTQLKSGKVVKIKFERNKRIQETEVSISKDKIAVTGGMGLFHKMDAIVGGVVDGLPADNAGLALGDIIKEINGATITHWVEMSEIITQHPGENISIAFSRDNTPLTIILKPDAIIEAIEGKSPVDRAGLAVGDIVQSINNKDIAYWKKELDGKGFFHEDTLTFDVIRQGTQLKKTVIIQGNNETGMKLAGKIGILPPEETVLKRYGIVASIKEGCKFAIDKIGLTMLVLGNLISGNLSVKTLGGPIIIAKMSGAAAKSGISFLLTFTAFLSINLGIINLLPIPILDGGHLFFLLIELIMRKPLSVKKMEVIQKIGFALLILLILTVTYNDITRIIPQKYLDFIPWR